MNDLISGLLGLLVLFLIEIILISVIVYGIWKIAVGQCQEAVIDTIEYDGRRRGGVHMFAVYVKTYVNYSETRLRTLESFSSMWFYKNKWERLKRKYIGKRIHIYVNPNRPYAQTITRELSWRFFLPIVLVALFFVILLLVLGGEWIMTIIALL